MTPEEEAAYARAAKRAAKWSPHVRVLLAQRAGRGVRLSVVETAQLAFDGAVETCAENDIETEMNKALGDKP